MTTLIVDRLRRLSFFSETGYISLNPDLDGREINPTEHAAAYVGVENRQLYKLQDLARAWGNALVSTKGEFDTAATQPEPIDPAELKIDIPVASIFVSSSSDVEIKRIASCLVDDLSRVGVRASCHDETVDPGQDYGLTIVIAPHEFFRNGLGPLWAKTKLKGQGFVYNTAPLHTAEFRAALPFMLGARGVIDASPQMAHILRQASIPALHVQVTVPSGVPWLEVADEEHPLMLALPAAARVRPQVPLAWEARTIDIGFFGRFSRRRSAFFGRNAVKFAPYRTYIYHQQGGRDVLDETIERRHHSRIAAHLGAHSKLTLQIMEDDFHHFDWLGCVCRAMASGSVVVTDFCPPHPLLKAGMHLFEEDVKHIPILLDWLLRDEEGRRKAQDARAKTLALMNDRKIENSRANSLAAFLQTQLAEAI